MTRATYFACLVVVSLSFALTAGAQETRALVGVRVLAASGDRWLDGMAVVIRNGSITAVTPVGDTPLRELDVVTDLGGGYLTPGLIDLHTHLLLHPYDETSWNDQVLRESLEFRTIRAATAARSTLGAGFTTIRDLGTEGAGFADVALRDAVAAGVIDGPRIVAVTRAIVATGCYGPSGLAPRVEVPKGAEVADGVLGVRRAVRRQIAAGADWIKLYADYRRRPGDAATPTFSFEELTAACDEARSANVPVAVHATTDEAIRRAIQAGARTIEHGDGASSETLRLMRERDVALCPTLAASDAIARYRGWTPSASVPERLRRVRQTFAAALDAGVTIGCGSDAGVFRHGSNVRELELMVAYGMKPQQALAAATRVAAEILDRPDLGVVRPGATADLVVWEDDPLRDVSALRHPLLVMKEGRVASDERTRHAAERVERRVVATCKRMLADYSRGDIDAAERAFAPGAVIAMDHGIGSRRVLPADRFFARARRQDRPQGFVEWISGAPGVLVDGGVATVWAPFVLTAEGLVRTGVDVFQLVELSDGWRIVSLSYTNRSPSR